MTIQQLSWFRTIAMAFFAFAFTGLALYGIFAGSVDALYFGDFSLVGEPLQFWVVTTFYFAISAVCGYFAYFFAPNRNAA